MSECHFISDLHLSEAEPYLTQQFFHYLENQALSADNLYILGDLFNYWLGDDLTNAWSKEIASKIKDLSSKGVEVFFLCGNRDFLLGERFCADAGMTLLHAPTVIELNGEKVLLAHGDEYCTDDKRHQLFRRFSQSRIIKYLFTVLPGRFRVLIGEKLRKISNKRHIPLAQMDVIDSAIVKVLQRYQAKILIHGHTHRPMIRYLNVNKYHYQHIVLPDWDKKCHFLWYNCNMYEFKLV